MSISGYKNPPSTPCVGPLALCALPFLARHSFQTVVDLRIGLLNMRSSLFIPLFMALSVSATCYQGSWLEPVKVHGDVVCECVDAHGHKQPFLPDCTAWVRYSRGKPYCQEHCSIPHKPTPSHKPNPPKPTKKPPPKKPTPPKQTPKNHPRPKETPDQQHPPNHQNGDQYNTSNHQGNDHQSRRRGEEDIEF